VVAEIYIQNKLSLYSPPGRDQQNEDKTHYVDNINCFEKNNKERKLRWRKIVSSTYILMGRFNHYFLLDTTIMLSKNCPIIGEHVVIIFVTE